MTPEQRKNMHATLDDAINRGAGIQISIHPRHVGDFAALVQSAEHFAETEFVTSDDHSWTRHFVQPNNNGFVVHNSSNVQPRPEPVPNGSPVSA